MNTEQLVEWARAHRIAERTEAGFRNYMDNWKKDDRGDLFGTFRGKSNLKLLRTELHSLQLTHVIGYSDFVYCNINIYYLGQDIGHYRMVFTLEGEPADDVIHFDKYLDNAIREGTVKVEIVLKAIQ
ncbi:hypothetical protein GZH47_06580 [Paenibacillus rhizovicinus]|uniref:Uncharacterized protein n=1 Tax=Paenibacillus rhizovicinus TaxID=2704463 RepID=A0A6C0NWP6_9BACL|nr:hypothetical protein [Paenibacillus rhizovicinus]QHW30551.1 hypothetical protein GZH47_06580 [Paenibacillus rhizovicinus]